MRSCVAYIDGGSRGNPGIAGYGVSVVDGHGTPLASLYQSLGIRTNNFAEYSALLAALQFAKANHFDSVKVFADSELLVKQVSGIYRVKNPDLKRLFDQAKTLISGFKSFSIEHVSREQNREADRLANLAMDNHPADDSATPQGLTPRKVLAIYQDGLFKPLESLCLPAGRKYYLQIDPADEQ